MGNSRTSVGATPASPEKGTATSTFSRSAVEVGARQQTTKPRPARAVRLTLGGAGLVLLSLILFHWWPRGPRQAETEVQVIPAAIVAPPASKPEPLVPPPVVAPEPATVLPSPESVPVATGERPHAADAGPVDQAPGDGPKRLMPPRRGPGSPKEKPAPQGAVRARAAQPSASSVEPPHGPAALPPTPGPAPEEAKPPAPKPSRPQFRQERWRGD
jgi:hypothetical protein